MIHATNYKLIGFSPGDEIFNTNKAGDCVKDEFEADVLKHLGDKEAVTSDSSASSGSPDMAYAAGRSIPAMNTDYLSSLRDNRVELDENNKLYPDNKGREEALAVIEPHIYPTVWDHSGIFPRFNYGVFNRGNKFKIIGEDLSRKMFYALLLYSIYPLKYMEVVFMPNMKNHLSTPLKIL